MVEVAVTEQYNTYPNTNPLTLQKKKKQTRQTKKKKKPTNENRVMFTKGVVF